MNPELLQKYIAGNATEAEKQRVTEWIQENPENMREYMAQRKLHGSPDKPGGLSIQLCKSEKKEFYIRYSS